SVWPPVRAPGLPPGSPRPSWISFTNSIGHFHAGEAALAAASAPGKVPATTMLGAHPQEWYPLTEGPVIDLDALPAGQAVDAAIPRLLRLRRGECVELQAGTHPEPDAHGRIADGGGPETCLAACPRWSAGGDSGGATVRKPSAQECWFRASTCHHLFGGPAG